jgi:glycopeptide antibiotics resistance protein
VGARAAAVVLAAGSILAATGQPSWAEEDPCGGTGGIGQVIRVDEDAFTIRRNDDAQVQLVHLAPRASFRTAAGPGSLSALVVGSSVTLVGGPNRDGSFTADAVVVCTAPKLATDQDAESAGPSTGQRPTRRLPPQRSTGQPPAAARYQEVSRILDVSTIGLAILTWCGVVLLLRRRRQQVGAIRVLFLAVFGVYVYKVVDVTLLQFQSLLLLQHLVPGLRLKGMAAGTSVNLLPLVTLTQRDVTTSLLNVLMMMPFGFGLPFVSRLRFPRVIVAAAVSSLAIETLQWVTGALSNTTFRVADVNDIIFNTGGAAIGYVLFIGFVRVLHAARRDRPIGRNALVREWLDRSG